MKWTPIDEITNIENAIFTDGNTIAEGYLCDKKTSNPFFVINDNPINKKTFNPTQYSLKKKKGSGND